VLKETVEMVNFQNYRGCFVPPLRSQNLQHQLPSKALNAMLPFSTSLVATETGKNDGCSNRPNNLGANLISPSFSQLMPFKPLNLR
jgi:hypothetical protein